MDGLSLLVSEQKRTNELLAQLLEALSGKSADPPAPMIPGSYSARKQESLARRAALDARKKAKS